MIEVVSDPQNLKEWNPENDPFYLELYGETSPLLDMKSISEPLNLSNADKKQHTSTLPIYEYCWTLGLRGLPNSPYHVPTTSQQSSLTMKIGLFNHFKDHFNSGICPDKSDITQKERKRQGLSSQNSYWMDMKDPAAEVYVLFPTDGNWRMQELVATVKYLIPPPPQHTWLAEVDQIWQAVQPIVDDVGTLAQTAGTLTGQPEIDATGSMLSAIAKARINSVPQTGGYAWSVIKETFKNTEKDVLEGLRWTLPRQMFTDLGGRLTGSVSVSFIGAVKQSHGAASPAEPWEINNPELKPICAYAAIYESKGTRVTNLIKLKVQPRKP